MRNMRQNILLLCLFLCLILTGCTKDARAKRATSLLNVKTQVAKAEFEQAKTDVEKVAVAKQWFDTAPRYTQAVDDYMQGKQPTNDIPENTDQ